MASYIVTTAADTVNSRDGLLSLREAVALANADARADTITFDPALFSVNISAGALDIAAGAKLTIVGDHDNDGISDILLTAGQSHHFNVESGATLNLVGLDLYLGRSLDPGEVVAKAADGRNGKDGAQGEGAQSHANDLAWLFGNGGRDGDAGEDGDSGSRGADGRDREVRAGSIFNEGQLNLTRVGFGQNEAGGGEGGGGGAGGAGGTGGQGGVGVFGNRVELGLQSNPLQNGVIDGGDGGDAGDGAGGGRGGDGGDGGSTAGAIYNAKGAAVSLTDVAFGGALTSGVIVKGNTSAAGAGGEGGNGGVGGGALGGGDGGDSGTREFLSGDTLVADVGEAGDGGDGGDSGGGGDGGAYGRSGDAAGAILNDGALTGDFALWDNDASTPDMSVVDGDFGNGGFAFLPGRGGAGGTGNGSTVDFEPDGENGRSGVTGLRGDKGKPGVTGKVDDILTRKGGKADVSDGAALVYIHGVSLDVAEGGEASFNIIRLGAETGDLTVRWEVRPDGRDGAERTDFAGGASPSGIVTIKGSNIDTGLYTEPFKKVTFAIAEDTIKEASEGFKVVLTSASLRNADVLLGTSEVEGTIIDRPSGPKPIEGTPGDDRALNGGRGDDAINGNAGNDKLDGKAGADALSGGPGNDTLIGGDGADRLDGGTGGDRIVGGLGRDQMTGGAGGDVFAFAGVADSRTTVALRDVIRDFDARFDTLDLSAIDANTTRTGNQAFRFIDDDAFSGAAGQLRFTNGLLFADVNGDRTADFAVQLLGRQDLSASDFVL